LISWSKQTRYKSSSGWLLDRIRWIW